MFVIPTPQAPEGRARDQVGTHAQLHKRSSSTHAPRHIGRAVQDLARLVVEQIRPFPIHALDEPDLPKPAPFFQLLLTSDCSVHQRMHLVVDQTMHPVFLVKPSINI